MPTLTTRPRGEPCRQRGMSMVEVMVACLVLSAGLSTIAAIQTKAVFNSGDAALQGLAAQILSGFSEAKLVEPNVGVDGATQVSTCNGVYADTYSADQTYFSNLLDTPCATTRRVVNADSRMTSECDRPFKSSVNVYCQSSRITIDFRQPVWTH